MELAPGTGWDQMRRHVLSGAALDTDVLFGLARWFKVQEGAHLLSLGVRDDLEAVLAAAETTVLQMSDYADEKAAAAGKIVEPEGEEQRRMRALGAYLSEAAFAVTKMYPDGSTDLLLLDAIDQLTRTCRHLPWPVWAPLAVLVQRSKALIMSKADRYQDAWDAHAVAKDQLTWMRNQPPDRISADVLTMLDDIESVLWLSETGTGCRQLEFYVAEGAVHRQNDKEGDLEALIEGLDGINRTIESATRSIEIISGIVESGRVLPQQVTDDFSQLLATSALRQPGVMGARACALKLVLCEVMQHAGEDPERGDPDWQTQAALALDQFAIFYSLAEDDRDLIDPATGPPIRSEHRRSLVQLRLAIALLRPGSILQGNRTDPESLSIRVLDDAAVCALSEDLRNWIDDDGTPKPANANTIGSSVSPTFNDAVVAIRESFAPGTGGGYAAWRCRYPDLDQKGHLAGRDRYVRTSLGL